MKNKKLSISLIFIFGLFCIAVFAIQRKSAEASNDVDLTLKLSKQVLQLGEILSVETTITNKTKLPISIYLGRSHVNFAALKIATKKDMVFNTYARPITGADSFSSDDLIMPTQINPKESLNRQSKILWNYKPQVEHLSERAAKSETEGRILSDYAFPEAGTYFIKAVSVVIRDKKPISLESEPIEITIVEPKGDDLEVWNKMKTNGEIGHLLQEGDLTRGYHSPEGRAKFQAEVEQILTDYPNSFYAASLSQSLAKFKASEAKRCELMEKMKPKP